MKDIANITGKQMIEDIIRMNLKLKELEYPHTTTSFNTLRSKKRKVLYHIYEETYKNLTRAVSDQLKKNHMSSDDYDAAVLDDIYKAINKLRNTRKEYFEALKADVDTKVKDYFPGLHATCNSVDLIRIENNSDEYISIERKRPWDMLDKDKKVYTEIRYCFCAYWNLEREDPTESVNILRAAAYICENPTFVHELENMMDVANNAYDDINTKIEALMDNANKFLTDSAEKIIDKEFDNK